MNFALKHHGKSRSQLARSLSSSHVAVVMFATTMEQGTPRPPEAYATLGTMNVARRVSN